MISNFYKFNEELKIEDMDEKSIKIRGKMGEEDQFKRG